VFTTFKIWAFIGSGSGVFKFLVPPEPAPELAPVAKYSIDTGYLF